MAPRAWAIPTTYLGGYAEQMLLAAPLMLEVPNGLPTEHAALTEPLAVGVHAVEKAALKGDESPLVVGCGPVGLAVIAALRLKDVRPIVAADFSPKRRELAAKMGADIVVDPAKEIPYAKLRGRQARGDLRMRRRAGPDPADLREGAARRPIVVVGVCMEPDTIEPMFGIVKELNLQFVLGYTPEEFARCLRLLAEGQVDAPGADHRQGRARRGEGRLRRAGKPRAPHQDFRRTLALSCSVPRPADRQERGRRRACPLTRPSPRRREEETREDK